MDCISLAEIAPTVPPPNSHFMIRLLPWKFFVRYAARRYGVIDPATWLARIRRFAQPSEVAEPLELLRAGIIFHARGLVNAKAIQHNLDWVWPYWVERQFNPTDSSFIPRAFSFSHINLTHRNWTAVGLPDLPVYPIVDPRGLVTPLNDGWSLDFWILTENGRSLLPSKLGDDAVRQTLQLDPTLKIITDCVHGGLELRTDVTMGATNFGTANLCVAVGALADADAWLVVAVRPYNPEGVQFVDQIVFDANEQAFHVNEEASVRLSDPPDSLQMAHYADGDVYLDLQRDDHPQEVHCPVGMATAAALFRLREGEARQIQVSVNLDRDLKDVPLRQPINHSWSDATRGTAELSIPDARMQFLYDAAVRTMILLSAGDLVPGPYTYRRFWFRDACLMLHPMIAIGLIDRSKRVIESFPNRQTLSGYFLSQEGEWDSNGQVLWIAARYASMTGTRLGKEVEQAIRKGVRWLRNKRSHASGLLPAGFSAEHLGPNDFYFWDNFWALGGLRNIASYWHSIGDDDAASEADILAEEFSISIESCITAIPSTQSNGAVPAAPGRRMDAGAIGSMVADYPLQLYPPGDERMRTTGDFLIGHCFQRGGFFQEMIHSGINAYLTLDLAQSLLRKGDPRYGELIRRVAELASPTGQWPEAIHPQTFGGCMGDGQHGWAAGEWIMMIRNCFVREEAESLIIGSGILSEWLAGGEEIRFGPTQTAWGPVRIRIDQACLHLDAHWRGDPPRVTISVPGFEKQSSNLVERVFPLKKI